MRYLSSGGDVVVILRCKSGGFELLIHVLHRVLTLSYIRQCFGMLLSEEEGVGTCPVFMENAEVNAISKISDM